MVAVEVLVGANLEVTVRPLALGIACDGQALVDVHRHSAERVNELLKAVNVEHDEVVDLEAEGLSGGQLEGVGPGVVGRAHAIDVAGLYRRPDLVSHVVGVVTVTVFPDETVGEVPVQRRIRREWHSRGVAGDLEDRGITVGGINRRHHDRVSVHGVLGAVVTHLAVVGADEQDVDSRLGRPNRLDVLVVVDGWAGAGPLIGEDPAEHVVLIVGIPASDS